ncbi:hypothetical protein DM02DRAFT_617216 [Periconia macrospinosa]|uniref:Uncharacterized protein n=1 Tax=Periconia macrospinosa TaxID=97972 RepID=A0A2V1DEG6_9PLEO|nr:hypothetical protein DM02DRAFT_617216 [Periconia macrospinosa]
MSDQAPRRRYRALHSTRYRPIQIEEQSKRRHHSWFGAAVGLASSAGFVGDLLATGLKEHLPRHTKVEKMHSPLYYSVIKGLIKIKYIGLVARKGESSFTIMAFWFC